LYLQNWVFYIQWFLRLFYTHQPERARSKSPYLVDIILSPCFNYAIRSESRCSRCTRFCDVLRLITIQQCKLDSADNKSGTVQWVSQWQGFSRAGTNIFHHRTYQPRCNRDTNVSRSGTSPTCSRHRKIFHDAACASREPSHQGAILPALSGVSYLLDAEPGMEMVSTTVGVGSSIAETKQGGGLDNKGIILIPTEGRW
jgi:hypothetical protein